MSTIPMDDLESGDVDSKRHVKRNGELDDAEQYLGDMEAPRQRRGGVLGAVGKFMDLLVEYGVEERGIQPRPEDVGTICESRKNKLTEEQERDELNWKTYLMQFTFWAALNTNILTVCRRISC
jgi:hypothetical protein